MRERRRVVVPLLVALVVNVVLYAGVVYPLSQRVANIEQRDRNAEEQSARGAARACPGGRHPDGQGPRRDRAGRRSTATCCRPIFLAPAGSHTCASRSWRASRTSSSSVRAFEPVAERNRTLTRCRSRWRCREPTTTCATSSSDLETLRTIRRHRQRRARRGRRRRPTERDAAPVHVLPDAARGERPDDDRTRSRRLALLVAVSRRSWSCVIVATPHRQLWRLGAPRRQCRRRAADAVADDGSPVADVRLELLQTQPARTSNRRRAIRSGSGRKRAATGAAPAPPCTPPVSSRCAAAVPPGPPAAAADPLEVHRRAGARAQGQLAVFSDAGGNVINGKEGDIIDGRYRLLKIGAESADLAYRRRTRPPDDSTFRTMMPTSTPDSVRKPIGGLTRARSC